MTTVTQQQSSTRVVFRVGLVLAALLAASDIVLSLVLVIHTAPLPVVIIGDALDLATLLGAVFAWRGHAWGTLLVLLSRLLSLLTSLPIFFVPSASPFIAGAVVTDVVAVAAMVLVAIGLRRR